jgi:hypothetical protein
MKLLALLLTFTLSFAASAQNSSGPATKTLAQCSSTGTVSSAAYLLNFYRFRPGSSNNDGVFHLLKYDGANLVGKIEIPYTPSLHASIMLDPRSGRLNSFYTRYRNITIDLQVYGRNSTLEVSAPNFVVRKTKLNCVSY